MNRQEPMNLCQGTWDNLKQFFYWGMSHAVFSNENSWIGRQDVIKQSLEAMRIRTLHHKITSKLLLIGLERRCLKTIIFGMSLIFRNSLCCTPALTSKLNDNTLKKDSLERVKDSQALKASSVLIFSRFSSFSHLIHHYWEIGDWG